MLEGHPEVLVVTRMLFGYGGGYMAVGLRTESGAFTKMHFSACK